MARGSRQETGAEEKEGMEAMEPEKGEGMTTAEPERIKGKAERAKEEMVPIRLFRDSDRYRDDERVTVNGKTTIVPRGRTVSVPKAVAEVLENAMRQKEQADFYMEAKNEEYENGLAKLE